MPTMFFRLLLLLTPALLFVPVPSTKCISGRCIDPRLLRRVPFLLDPLCYCQAGKKSLLFCVVDIVFGLSFCFCGACVLLLYTRYLVSRVGRDPRISACPVSMSFDTEVLIPGLVCGKDDTTDPMRGHPR